MANLTYQYLTSSCFIHYIIIMNESINELVKPWKKKNSPGLIIAADVRGLRLFSVMAGYANLDFDIRIKEETVFQIASVSKQFTAACIAMLILENKISLDDHLTRWFSDFPPYAEKITVDHLIHHTSGLRDTLPLKIIAGKTHEDYFSLSDAIELIRSQRALNFEPGSRFLYTNSGYALLASIVEKVTARTLGQYARETFFIPLQMEKTLFDEDHSAIIKNRALSYEKTEYGYKTQLKNDDECGATGILTTINDLMIWNDNLATGRVGGEEFVSLMHQTGKMTDGKDTGYAFGLFIDEKFGKKRVHHAGSYLGFHAQSIRYPEEELSIVCLSNCSDTSPVNICDRVYQIIRGDVKKESFSIRRNFISSSELEKWAGVYKSPKTNWVAEALTNDRGSLTINAFSRSYETTALSTSEFLIEKANTNLQFYDSGESMTHLKVFIDGVLFDEFEKQVASKPFNEQLQEYCGAYYCDELQAQYVIVQRNGELLVNRRGQLFEKLNFGHGDVFILGTAFVEFGRDQNRHIINLTVRGERIMGIDFWKTRNA
jgi:CubicO group peptidase (beta-lactamase class C family)